MKIVQYTKERFCSSHIQLALVTGANIIVPSYVSKRVLQVPMDSTYMTVPGLFIIAAEAALGLKKRKWYANVYLWMALSVFATAAVIANHLA